MARWRAYGGAGVMVALTAGGAWGCAVFTNLDVDPYTLADAADGGHVTAASLCDAKVCPTLSLGCRAASDCDAGDVCCLVPTAPTTVDFVCQPTSCSGPFAFQLCKVDAECTAAPCVRQACSIDGVIVRDLGACGTLPGCAPL